MSSARISKLEALLRRVEERRQQPRLHAVSPRESSPTVPDLERVAPASQRSSLPSPAASEPIELPTSPPAAIEPPRKQPSISPLETAMAQLDDSGPLELPAPVVSRAEPRAPAPAGPDMLVTHRPGAEPLELEAPVELTQPKRPHVEREPTIEFETAKVRVNARELRAVGEPMGSPAPAGPAPSAGSPPAPLSAPSQTLEAAPLPSAAQPARAISAARVEAPKTFGELLDLSLALRP
ncbi:MAG TPA: hypothetical protein VFZ61_11225 [Polyangiales bacterium]